MKNIQFYLISLAVFCAGAGSALMYDAHYMHQINSLMAHQKQVHELEKAELQIKMRAYQSALYHANKECDK